MSRKLAKLFFYASIILTAMLLLLILKKANPPLFVWFLLIFLIGLFGCPLFYLDCKKDYDKEGFSVHNLRGLVGSIIMLVIGLIMLIKTLFFG